MSDEAMQTICQILIALGIVLGAILTGLGGYGAYFFGKRIDQRNQAQSAQSGEIKAQEIVLSGEDDIWPKLECGTSGVIFVWHGPGGKNSSVFRIGKETNLEIVREDGQIKVSTIIRDKDGKVIADLVKNEWKVNSKNSFDRNYSSDALEV